MAGDDAERVGTFEVGDGGLDRLQQVVVPLQVVVDLMRDDLGVGVRGKAVTRLGLDPSQGLMVLDDAIVHHRHRAAADVWVGIAFAGFAMSRPAGVGDAQVPG